MKTLCLSLFCALVSFGAPAAASHGRAIKANLDLPFDPFARSSQDEAAPELIRFYGQQYEGDGFFFCIDRSRSSRDGELDLAKKETSTTIASLANGVEFALVFFDERVDQWPAGRRPARASEASRDAALDYIEQVQSGSGSCVRTGLLRAVGLANRSRAKRRVVIYLGDAGTSCPGKEDSNYAGETLRAVKSHNIRRHEVHSICIAEKLGTPELAWCQALAFENDGTFVHLQPPD